MNAEDLVADNKRTLEEEPLKTFLFIQTIGLGDIIVTSQACQDIKRFYRNSKIIFIVPKGLKQAAQGIKEVDEIYEFDKYDEHKGFFGMIKFLLGFKHKGGIDYSFTTFSCDRALTIATLLGAKEKHTYRPTNFMLNFKDLLNMKIHLVNKDTNTAEDLQNWVADIFEDRPMSKKVDFQYPKDCDSSIERKLTDLKAIKYPLIALCPCSSESEKDWTPKEAVEFIDKANEDGRIVVFVGAKKDTWFVKEVKSMTDKPFCSLMGNTNIFEIAALANRVQVFVSVDTGPMHVSYASGAPTVCMFFRSRDFYKWAPKEYKNTLVLHRPEGITGEKAYELVNDFIKQQTAEE